MESANQVAHVDCGNCRMLLMYQYGARSVKCAVCNFVTSVGVSFLYPNTQKKKNRFHVGKKKKRFQPHRNYLTN